MKIEQYEKASPLIEKISELKNAIEIIEGATREYNLAPKGKRTRTSILQAVYVNYQTEEDDLVIAVPDDVVRELSELLKIRLEERLLEAEEKLELV